jgi:tripartite-type tricarboxylate transporter receptor subunit TctC
MTVRCDEIILPLNEAAARAIQAESFKRLGVNEGLIMIARPPEELDRYFLGEEEHWREVIHDAGIKPE